MPSTGLPVLNAAETALSDAVSYSTTAANVVHRVVQHYDKTTAIV